MAGPLAFVFLYFFYSAEGLSAQAQAVLACTAWVAIWWITEAAPISATALLPIILFPLTGALPIKETVTGYSHPYIFLFIGGFILAIAMEKWHLHKRIALLIIKRIGLSKPRIILGFMVATAFLSMWISNTATTVMMLPIGMAIVAHTGAEALEQSGFSKALMLGIAYAASIGGIATLIGTPPNLILAGVIEETYQVEISFLQWFIIGFPFAVVMLGLCWLYLTRYAYKFKGDTTLSGASEIEAQIQALGPMSKEEKRVLWIFSLTALAWVIRAYVLVPFIPALDDTIIALIAGTMLFLVPSSRKGEALLDWTDMTKLPWGVLLLFGGGIALAVGFDSSGLALWLGTQLTSIQGISLLALLLILIFSVNFLTEITSNLATTSVILPILAPLALSLNMHPYPLMAAAAMAASCAFMLPVATPPNALVFGTGYFRIGDMVRVGFWLNLISIVVLLALIYFLLPLLWDLDPGNYPTHFGL
jgi:sodium-dependent dicarboxylate transporter 2/3/5